MIGILLTPEAWYVIGITLIILDLVVGFQFFVLSFGVGALITGALLDLVPPDSDAWLNTGSWEVTVLFFGLASLAVIFPIRKAAYLLYRDDKDINDY